MYQGNKFTDWKCFLCGNLVLNMPWTGYMSAMTLTSILVNCLLQLRPSLNRRLLIASSEGVHAKAALVANSEEALVFTKSTNAKKMIRHVFKL